MYPGEQSSDDLVVRYLLCGVADACGGPTGQRCAAAVRVPAWDHVLGCDQLRDARSIRCGALHLATGARPIGRVPSFHDARDRTDPRNGKAHSRDRTRALRRCGAEGGAAVVSPSVTVRPAFAVPIGEVRLASCERLNGELEALFLARENDEHRNPTPSHIPQTETFESRFNLFRWPDPCVQELRRFVLDAVARTVIEATSLTAEDLSRLKLHNHT